jgi:hypothetical protein
LSVIDFEALRQAELGEHPHRWGYLPRALDPDAAVEPDALSPPCAVLVEELLSDEWSASA